jgi:hypothetical protein
MPETGCQTLQDFRGKFRQMPASLELEMEPELPGGAGFRGGIPGILALAGIAIPATCILAFWHSGIFWHDHIAF